jgi:hypothetical protein
LSSWETFFQAGDCRKRAPDAATGALKKFASRAFVSRALVVRTIVPSNGLLFRLTFDLPTELMVY